MPDQLPVAAETRRRAERDAPRSNRNVNRGYITVVIAILFGLAFTATVLGTAAYVRSAQTLSLAAHAQVQAQLKAWTGVEVVRQYLVALQASGNLIALATTVNAGSTVLTITGITGTLATLVAVNSTSNPTLFTANIVGTTASGTRAQSTSTIQAVYSVSGGGSGTTALNFSRNLALGGAITVVPPASSTTQFAINVSGDVNTSGNLITGVSVINSTGTINIGSGSTFQTLNSNCDVVIKGGVTVVGINALRNICETGGTTVSGTALANGSVASQAIQTSNGTINAITSPTGSASCSAAGYAGAGTLAATCPVPAVIGVDLSYAGAGAATCRWARAAPSAGSTPPATSRLAQAPR
jgi:hypothetical protein